MDWRELDKGLYLMAMTVQSLSREQRLAMVIAFEAEVDAAFGQGLLTQEQAWDAYFSLIHECDEMRFRDHRPRILAKIDPKRYNPFRSTNPGIVMLARYRAEEMGLLGNSKPN